MKLLEKNSANSGTNNKHSKSTKKSKGTKKNPEKASKDHNLSVPQEVLPKQAGAKNAQKKAQGSEQPSQQPLPHVVNENLKKPKLDKRKQDSVEWKTLKKVDYQRLETVMEEGQISGEEASSKHNLLESGRSDSGSDAEHNPADVARVKTKKSWLYSLMALAEPSEPPKPEDDSLIKAGKRLLHRPHTDPAVKGPPIGQKTKVLEIGEPNEALSQELSQNKRSVILSGMMEILPIFSNDRFVSSRHAISIEEHEEPDGDRHGMNSDKTHLELKSGKEPKAIDMKPLISVNSMKREGSFDGGFMERLRDIKEVTERKLRYKRNVFTDRNVYRETSSPFINSLLVLSPFSSERERMLNEENLKEEVDDCGFFTASDISSDLESDGKRSLTSKICLGVTLTTLCLVTLLLSLAWKSYRPPCLVDFLVDVLPLVHRRRSIVDRFFDRILIFVSTFLDGLPLSFSSDHGTELSAF